MSIPIDAFTEYFFLINEIKKERDINKLFRYMEDSLKYVLEKSKSSRIERDVIYMLDNIRILKEAYEIGLNLIEELGMSFRKYNEIYLDLLKNINYELIKLRVRANYMSDKKLSKSLENLIEKTGDIYHIKSFIEGLENEITLPEELKREYFNRALNYLKI